MTSTNAFTFLRLLFALTVVVAHSYALGGFGRDGLYRVSGGQVEIGGLAVMGFFVISGFLIAGSAMRWRESLWRYFFHRCVRLLPGFWLMQILTVFVMVPVIMCSRYPDELSYWDAILIEPNSAYSYLLSNAGLVMRQYSIFSVFAYNQTAEVNGSLWSLGPEIICYGYLGLLVVVGGFRWKWTGPGLFVALYSLNGFLLLHPEAATTVAALFQKFGILGYSFRFHRGAYLAFLAGLAYWQLREHFVWRGWLAALALLALAGSCRFSSFEMVWPLALPYLVLYLAHRLPFQGLEKCGDFSYGIYIYAFPIQQCLYLAGWSRHGHFAYLLGSMILSVGAGVLSWLLIEKPVLTWARTVRLKPLSGLPASKF